MFTLLDEAQKKRVKSEVVEVSQEWPERKDKCLAALTLL